MTLAVIGIVTAISLITASSSIGSSSGSIITPVFAVKKDPSKTGSTSSDSSLTSTHSSSTTKKASTKRHSTSVGGSIVTSSERKFFRCVAAVPGGKPSKADVDKCWDQVFGGSSSSHGSTHSSTALNSSGPTRKHRASTSSSLAGNSSPGPTT